MSRRKLIWHIGLADAPRPLLPANLSAHSDSLCAAGVEVVATAEESRLATHELLRTHQQAGLARREVEGRWARICDRVWQHKGVSMLSTPDLCAADKDQIRLALNPLIGVEVHLVVTLDSFSQQIYGSWLAELRSGRSTGWEKYVARVLASRPDHAQAERFWGGHDLPALLSRWGWTFHSDRLHVVASPCVESHWSEFLDIAGVASSGLDAVVPAYADPAGVAVLRKVNRQLEEPIGPGTVALLTSVDREGSAMPVAPTGELAPLVSEWAAALSGAGQDVRGDLAMLVEDGPETSLPGPRDQLGVAVDVLTEALTDNARLRTLVDSLEADRERLERKRRKLKRRLKRVRAAGEAA
ncbi:MAG: hypothetical protein ABIR34_07505 [Marmoricola sp.]